ncbi:M48 family metalloprotease [Nisaea nitritireducens]|uniref:hypothetical protein n=1 Tax=Nisaea nitritireducens TaxID=568392 RepID=UPI001867053A|nr:hypothetical protein [Nisaea nitritireducens]
MHRSPFYARAGRTVLVPLVFLAVLALILADIFKGADPAPERPRAPGPMPSVPSPDVPAPRIWPKKPEEPGCIQMPGGILVCDQRAHGGSGFERTSSTLGASVLGSPCVRDHAPPRPEAVAIVDTIVATIGVTRNFEVREGDFGGSGCIAVAGRVGGKRMIIYDREHFHWDNGRVIWSEAGIMAHEIGHLLMSHPRSLPYRELEADYFAGFALAKLQGTLAQALAWTPLVGEQGSKSYPPRVQRIEAAALGWASAKMQEKGVTGKSGPAWLGEPFEIAGVACRVGHTGREALSPRIACDEGGSWVWRR